MSSDVLFSPFTIKHVTLRNRLGDAPMTRMSSPGDGIPRQDVLEFLVRRAENGAALVTSEAIVTDYESAQGYPGQARLTTQRQIDAWEALLQPLRHFVAEMTRLGLALGARAETFMGLSGLGDLVLTATGDLSRNRRVGLLLAQDQTLDQILTELGHVAEGVYSAHTVLERAQACGVEMPITAAVVAVLQGRMAPRAAVSLLMQREARNE